MDTISLLFVILLFFISFCKSSDRIIPGKPLSHGDVLVSDGGVFALGFFSPTNSSNRSYIGIWYHNIPECTVVWVANRANPITTPSSAVLAVTNRSDLVLSDSRGHTLWTTNNNITTTGGAGVAAVLLKSGNLIVQLPNGTVAWQSFDHPTDTIVPGMKVWARRSTGPSQRIVSWKGRDDPSPGDFSGGVDPNSPLQALIWRGSSPYYRSGVWKGSTVSGSSQISGGSIISQTIYTGDGVYVVFNVSQSQTVRYTLDYSGKAKLLIWQNDSLAWRALTTVPTKPCDLYASCGPFGYCDTSVAVPTCKCLDGFELINGLNFSMGCRRKEALQCGDGDIFLALPNMKLPDKFLFIIKRSFDDCATECRRNCSCTAYAYVELKSAGRCLVWMGELIDTEKTSTLTGNFENLYLRLAGSSSADHLSSGDKGKGNVVQIVVPVVASVLTLASLYLVWISKCRGKRRHKEIRNRLTPGDLNASNEFVDANLEFPFMCFEDIVAATNNFSDYNMLGQGGFGNVYKGVLEDGKEVAVKRLGRSSRQGAEEFKNEVILIAQLQHRNLVRLLACCIHGDEKLLVYEYLPNKSLDIIIFNAARKSVLDWSMRFKIIKGIARGLLYLHQDSRLTVIHRDLKTSNILLDAEMMPKISDFGMARIFGGNQHHGNTNRIAGTYGYMSPEYVMEGVFSVKSDTYSFGVLLLEIVSGLKNSSAQVTKDFLNLMAYAWSLWKDEKAHDLLDSSLVESCSLDEVIRCVHIGLLCVQDDPNARPLMSSVVFMLENKNTVLSIPKQPVYFAERSYGTRGAQENIENSGNNVSLTLTTLVGR